jgi:hypothetical protein
LSRLNHAANLRRQVAVILDQWVEENSQALLARWVREGRALLRGESRTLNDAAGLSQSDLPFDRAAALELLPRRQEPLPKLARHQQR